MAGADLQNLPLEATLKSRPNKPRSRLTFGVEIELAIATLLPNTPDPDPSDPRPVTGLTDGPQFSKEGDNLRSHIAATLRKHARVNVECKPETGLPDWAPNSIESWILERDVTIEAPDTRYTYIQIELISPPFYFSHSAIATVRRVCTILSNNYRVNCNDSTALHVHVGNARKGFHVKTIRNLLATLWTFESVLDKMHPTHRHNDDEYAPSFRRKSRLAEAVMRRMKTPVESVDTATGGLEQLLRDTYTAVHLEQWSPESEDDVESPQEPVDASELLDLALPADGVAVKGGGRTRVDVSNLVGAKVRQRTVEFRQHGGTCGGQQISKCRFGGNGVVMGCLLTWAGIVFCVGLLEFCDTVERGVLSEFLRRHIRDVEGDFAPERVLEALGLGDLNPFYTKWMEEMKRTGLDVRNREETVIIKEFYGSYGGF
jgi:hypothetical protein